MAPEPMVLTAAVGLAVSAFWLIAPRCPECSSLLSVRDTHDPSLRHCRRCLAIYRKGRRP
jgi:hypothetical protein